MSRPEVLSPCGGPESLPAAINSGADAVYLGAKNFSARHNAVNFSDAELFEAVRECHRNGVLVYLTVNTVVLPDELKSAADVIKLACEAGIDGLIVQDMAIYEIVKTACPEMPVHASTQMSLHTRMGAYAAKELGFKRVVAARELPLGTLQKMADTGIEIEAFAHGALCMCVSGQCYLSAAMGGRSANRGLCAGACRLPFSAKGLPGEDERALSLKDLSYCHRVKELAEAGVTSLKIEGRMKRPEYVAASTNALRKAVDGEDFDGGLLRAVFSRSGFTDSYLDGDPGKEIFGARLKEDVTAARDALPELKKLYEKPMKRFTVDFDFSAKAGEEILLKASCDGDSVTVFGDTPEAALTRATTSDEISEQLSKLGGTIYNAGKIDVKTDSGLMIPKSALNRLRRMALEKLDENRINSFKKPAFDGSGLSFDFPMLLILKRPRLRAKVENLNQLKALPDGVESLIPLREAASYVDSGLDVKKAALYLPRLINDEEKTAEELRFAKKLGFDMVECGNIGQIKLARELGFTPSGGFGLNITNSLSARFYSLEQGVKRLTLSPELKPSAQSCIAVPAETGAIVYGRLPLMITRCCPIAAEVGCKACKKRLIDRTGEEFKILCHKNEGYFELLNSRPIWLADKLGNLNLDYGDVWFTAESPEECRKIWEDFSGELSPSGKFTRGFKIK